MAAVLCPVVVGRQAELAALDAALAAALGGAGRLVFLAGEPGIGKSRLARGGGAGADGRRRGPDRPGGAGRAEHAVPAARSRSSAGACG